MITRWIELKKEKSYLVLGPRRAGKSTLLKHYFPDYRYTTLDDLDELSFAQKDLRHLL